MATDTEQREANERIATAMGLERRVSCNWRVDGCYQPEPPDFFADPKAADGLMRWLKGEHHDYTFDGVDVELMGDDSWRARIHVGDIRCDGQHPDWKHALALAADAAIKEAERG